MFHMTQHGNNIFPYPRKYSIHPTEEHVHAHLTAPARRDVTHIDSPSFYTYLVHLICTQFSNVLSANVNHTAQKTTY
jgi:hypothetical protein